MKRQEIGFSLKWGAAKSLGKPVFGWKTPRARVPEPVKQITDYFTFDSTKPNEVKQMLQMIGNLAKSIFESDEQGSVRFT